MFLLFLFLFLTTKKVKLFYTFAHTKANVVAVPSSMLHFLKIYTYEDIYLHKYLLSKKTGPAHAR